MSKIFTRTFRVRWSELDASGQVGLGHYLRYLVETAYDWGDQLGLSAKNYEELGIFWLIRETELRLFHPLVHNDVFDFTIWMVNWQRVRGTRSFELRRKDNGQIIAQGSQHIVCMDSKTLRPTSLAEGFIDNFRLDDPRIFAFDRFPKITPPENSFVTQREVEWQDLDAQNHVNNAIYVGYAEEAALQELKASGWSLTKLAEQNLAFFPRRIHIQYLSPAVWGERLNISTHSLNLHQSGGSRYAGITRDDGSQVAECIMDWVLTNKETGEEQPLPAELVNSLLG